MEEIDMEEAPNTKFKQFDIISSPVPSDHHYLNSSTKNNCTNSKKIAQEWRILEKNLPESIFVRVYETRIDLLRAVIIGPPGTPYHNGLFFFDIHFPSEYPSKPPQFHYHAHGVRLNPNLYANGNVCLSLLNTWFGSKDEKWVPSKSTILQVLVSIQGLVLNDEPYYNEPNRLRKEMRSKQSMVYNHGVFLLSCKTMLYVASKPPQDFKEFVEGHFHECCEGVLEACRGYVRNGGGSEKLKKSMRVIYPKLESAFSKDKLVVASSLGIGENSLEIEKRVVKEGCGFGKLIGRCLGFKKVKEIEGGEKSVV